MSHITSISLDPESARLAQRMKREGKNFSKFVRECLFLYYRESSDSEHFGEQEHWEGCDPFCIPTRKHFCRICWPTGTPDLSALVSARRHVRVLESIREHGPGAGADPGMLIEGLWIDQGQGRKDIDLEPSVLAWLKAQAEDHNRFIMPLADLDLKGNAKPVKTEKPPKSLIRRLLSEMGR